MSAEFENTINKKHLKLVKKESGQESNEKPEAIEAMDKTHKIKEIIGKSGEVRMERMKIDPAQRVADVLDFFYRGRQINKDTKTIDGLEIMPELLKLLPKRKEKNDSIEQTKKESIVEQEFDLQDENVKESIVSAFKAIEEKIINEDNVARKYLHELGMTPIKKEYLWSGQKIQEGIKQILNQKKSDKYPYSDDIFIKGQIQKLQKNVSIDTGNLDPLVWFVQTKYNYRLSDLQDLWREVKPISDQAERIFKKIEKILNEKIDKNKPTIDFEGFTIYPKSSKYKGAIIKEIPDLSKQKTKRNIKIVPRDQVPSIKGGLIIDGNFGYDEQGNIINVADKKIIDHHDNLNTSGKNYETATIMASTVYKEKETSINKKLEARKKELKEMIKADPNNYAIDSLQKEISAMEKRKTPIRAIRKEWNDFADERKKIITMINHLDSDSISSIYTIRNPKKAKKYSEIINAITKCGDFLLGGGTLEYGVTARDYNYIFDQYKNACVEKIKQTRGDSEILRSTLNDKRESILDIDKQIDGIKILVNIDEEIINIDKEITILKQNKKGQEIGKANNERKDIINKKYPNLNNLEKIRKDMQGEINQIETKIKELYGQKVSAGENEKILSHILDKYSDIIENPFKYQHYLYLGREAEDRTVEQVTNEFAENKINIVVDNQDKDIVIISPGTLKEIPKYEPIDGLYFYLRKNDDFNKELVFVANPGKYSLGINVTNDKGLKKYDFNSLALSLKEKETQVIQELIDKQESQIADQISNNTNQKEIDKSQAKLQKLKDDQVKNTRSQLWRNRNQFLFCTKSYINKDGILQLIYDWKNPKPKKQPISKDDLAKAA